jgi:hypothetical protein
MMNNNDNNIDYRLRYRLRLPRARKAVFLAAALFAIGWAALFSLDIMRLSFAALRSYVQALKGAGQEELTRRLEAEVQLRDQEIAFLRGTLAIGNVSGGSSLKATTSRAILARVLGTRPAFLKHTLILDQGETEGIEPGMVVFLPPNRYVGRIEEVGEQVSLARTVLNPEVRIFGRAEESRAYGVIEGHFGTGAVFSGLTETGVPKVSEEVTSVGGTIQEGMALGRVAEIFHRADVSQFKARLTPAFEGLPQFVFLIRP